VSKTNATKPAPTFTITASNGGVVFLTDAVVGLWAAKGRAVDVLRTLRAFAAEPEKVVIKNAAGRTMVSY
jgi:hypothetical protein